MMNVWISGESACEASPGTDEAGDAAESKRALRCWVRIEPAALSCSVASRTVEKCATDPYRDRGLGGRRALTPLGWVAVASAGRVAMRVGAILSQGRCGHGSDEDPTVRPRTRGGGLPAPDGIRPRARRIAGAARCGALRRVPRPPVHQRAHLPRDPRSVQSLGRGHLDHGVRDERGCLAATPGARRRKASSDDGPAQRGASSACGGSRLERCGVPGARRRLRPSHGGARRAD